MLTPKKKAQLLKNAEVTTKGIKIRGEDAKGSGTYVTVNPTPLGVLKKRVIASTLAVSLAANFVGLALDWTPDMVHVAYPLAAVGALGLALLYFSKME